MQSLQGVTDSCLGYVETLHDGVIGTLYKNNDLQERGFGLSASCCCNKPVKFLQGQRTL